MKSCLKLSLFVMISIPVFVKGQNKPIQEMSLEEVKKEIQETVQWINGKHDYIIFKGDYQDGEGETADRWFGEHYPYAIKYKKDTVMGSVFKVSEFNVLYHTAERYWACYIGPPKFCTYTINNIYYQVEPHHIDTVEAYGNNKIKVKTSDKIEYTIKENNYEIEEITERQGYMWKGEYKTWDQVVDYSVTEEDRENKRYIYSFAIEISDFDMRDRMIKAFNHLVKCAKRKHELESQSTGEKF